MQKLSVFLKNYWIDGIFYLGFTIYSLYMASVVSFWHDEVTWTIRFVHDKTITETLYELSKSMYNLPCYYIVLNLFYRISENPVWLRVPSIVASLLAIYFIQKNITKFYGRNYRFIVFALACFFPIFFSWFSIALQIRPYSFLFFFASYSLYLYYTKLTKDSYQRIIWFSFIITLLPYTHWFGGLWVAAFAVTDLYLYIKKKIRIRQFIPYIICGIAFLPWMIALILNHTVSLDYWGEGMPYIHFIITLYLLSGHTYIWLLILLAMINPLVKRITKVNNRCDYNAKINPALNCIFIILFVWSVPWFYSNVINPNGSILVIRYFIILIPCLIILVAAIIYDLKNCYLSRILCLPGQKLITITAIITILSYMTYSMSYYYFYSYNKYFSNQRKLHNSIQMDIEKSTTNILFLSEEQMFLYPYRNKITKINFATNDLYDNYFVDSNNQGSKFRKIAIEKSSRILDKFDCSQGFLYIQNHLEHPIYYYHKDSRDYVEKFDENLCQYEIVYTTTYIPALVEALLNKYYIQTTSFEITLPFIYRYTKKHKLP